MEKIKITIAGIPYTIVTDDGAEYAKQLAQEIDANIQGIMTSGSFISPSQATVLALLNYADVAKKASEEADNMKLQLKEYLADAAQAKSERDMLKREIAKLKKGNNGEF